MKGFNKVLQPFAFIFRFSATLLRACLHVRQGVIIRFLHSEEFIEIHVCRLDAANETLGLIR